MLKSNLITRNYTRITMFIDSMNLFLPLKTNGKKDTETEENKEDTHP